MLSVRIDEKMWEKQDRELLEDLLAAACNDAVAKAKELHLEKMQSLTGGMSMPGLDDAMKQFLGGQSDTTS